MATLVTFHAHPDDESIATGGVMAKAAAEGHRVVLVIATKGEHGEVAEGVLLPDEALWQRRVEDSMKEGIGNLTHLPKIRSELERIRERIDQLEERITKLEQR